MQYGYNLPWSGFLGRIANCCLYCGNNGDSWSYSSSAVRCLSCNEEKPNEKLMAEHQAKYELMAKKWCEDRGIDYHATVVNYEKNLGQNPQERIDPIPNAGNDYIVWQDASKQMTDENYLAKKEEILALLRKLTLPDWWWYVKRLPAWENEKNIGQKAYGILENK